MNKKFISVILAAILAVSCAAVSAGAVEVEQEASKSGTIKFDGGDGWDNKTVCFYIWDDTTKEWATKDGWVSEDTWGSAKKIGGTKVEGEDTVYESYEFDLDGRDDHALFIIFHCRETSNQTMNCIINDSVFGKTAHRNGQMYENPVDSEKNAEGVEFDGASGVGIEKIITSSGKIQGDIIAPGKTPDGIVAKFVLDYLGKKEKISGEDIVTESSVADAISSFGTTNDAVWAKYKEFSGDEKYNEAEAKKFIKPTEETTSSETSSTDGTSSTSSTTSSKASTTGGTTTTTGGTGAATTTAAGDTGTANTGDSRGVAAFAGVLLAAAGTIIATRKKIED